MVSMKKYCLLLIAYCLFFGIATSPARAAISYGAGYYTNLCDSGTSAKFYNCDPGCNPSLGSCIGKNEGVVKWVCSGKWDQCLESESNWSNAESFNGMSCGKTAQISLFDKKCRRDDGSWDQTCVLKGYMVWYSGDCKSGMVVDTPKPTTTVVPTVKITPTKSVSLVPSATLTPTPTIIVKISEAPSVCGVACTPLGGCKAGLVCTKGVCRNPACNQESSCFCGKILGSAVATKPPETGFNVWQWSIVWMGIFGLGWYLKKMAVKVWK